MPMVMSKWIMHPSTQKKKKNREEFRVVFISKLRQTGEGGRNRRRDRLVLITALVLQKKEEKKATSLLEWPVMAKTSTRKAKTAMLEEGPVIG